MHMWFSLCKLLKRFNNPFIMPQQQSHFARCTTHFWRHNQGSLTQQKYRLLCNNPRNINLAPARGSARQKKTTNLLATEGYI